MKKRDLIAATI